DPDKDGVDVEVDACPDEPGPPDIDPRRNGCPKVYVRGSRIETLDAIAYDPAARLEPTPENDALLTPLLGVALKLPEPRKIRIEGHTDSRGDANANKRLGLARATTLAKWLTEHGVAAERLTPVGIGSERPIATNETEAGRKANRRIELHLE